MAEKSFPFDAIETAGIPDRVFYAEDFTRYFKQFIGNGVYPNPSSGLQIQTLYGNMVVTVKRGAAFINGYVYANTEDFEIVIDTAHVSYNRKDLIVVQLDLVNREIKTVYRPGVAAANPQSPELTRNADIYELQLAEILVRSGTQVILDTDITDTRLNASKCGIVAGLVQQIDTTTIFNSYMQTLSDAQIDIAEFKQEWIAETILQWQNWFNSTELEWGNWFNDAKAHTFVLVNTDFQDYSTKQGYTYITQFLQNGDIQETIKNKISEDILATKLTEFLANGDIRETITWTDPVLTVTNTTRFMEDGSIESEVS